MGLSKIIAVGGEPASGKSTLLKGFIKRRGGKSKFADGKHETLRYHADPKSKTIILGLYGTGRDFEGTDALSMAVSTSAKEFVENADRFGFKDWTVVFEGDRLFTQSFLDICRAQAETKIFVLHCKEDEKERRHKERNDSQSEAWLRGRRTKINNILESVSDVSVVRNETPEDTEYILDQIDAAIFKG